MMKILIQGAGLAGCTIAASLAKNQFDVTVVEKRTELFTDGAGIVLYSNALKFLDQIDVLADVKKYGVALQGNTEIWNADSTKIGTIIYKSIDPTLPSYVGINRNVFLKILHDVAVDAGAKFKFGTTVVTDSITGNSSDTVLFTDNTSEKFDLIIAADGTNSVIRTHLLPDQQSLFTEYGLWHSLHKRRPEINEKITVMGKDCRLGFVPLSDDSMYIWASKPEPKKIWITKENQPNAMKERFSDFTGIVKEVIDEISEDTYVHFTAVEEVHLPKPWFKGNVVFIGDSAHASLPFMAQGGAQALHDSIALSIILRKNKPLDVLLTEYTDFRYDVAKKVQTMSHKIGDGYRTGSSINLEAAQLGADSFYCNPENFNLPNDL